MKITINSPDGIGDFIMRMPLVQALMKEGHHLQLLVRRSATEFVRGLFPEAEVHGFAEDPYDQGLKKKNRPFRADMAAIRRFRPDLYVAAAFFLTFFDEEWMLRAGGSIPSAGFEAGEERWGSNTTRDPFELARRFSIRVPVSIVMSESEKYRRLADAIVGRPVEWTLPRPPPGEMMEAAGRLMAENGLERDGFYVACVGGRPGLRLKDWGEKNWAAFLSEVATISKVPIVFLGNREESGSIERIRSALPAGTVHCSLAGNPPSILVSYALVARSAGYLGRDGGVMHMAAATERPLLALFSGVHWPRFVPDAAQRLILTANAPCRGCNRQCPFPEAYCITRIPVEGVVEEWRRWDVSRGAKVVEFPADRTFRDALAVGDPVGTAWQRQIEERRRWQAEKPRGAWRSLVELVWR